MDILLRTLKRDPQGVQHHDTEFSGERLLIGSAPDADIQLLGTGVAPRHATLMAAGAHLQLRCFRDAAVKINGAVIQTAASLQVDDTIEIAGHRLRLTKAPAGFAFAIEIEPDPNVDAGTFELAFQTHLDQAWLSKRRLSWIALATVLVFTLAVPLFFATSSGKPPPTPATMPGIFARTFGDVLWSSGPLASVHAQATHNQCRTCHQTLFARVPDAACQHCHKNVVDHVTAERATLAGAEAMGGVRRCASCHREHGETLTELVPRADQLCTGCHANAATRFASLKLPDVRGFEEKEHPPFAPRLLVPTSADAFDWKWEKTPLAIASDHSNLKFSHQLHLDKARVTRRSDGGALTCNDCHRPTVDGTGFLPIAMQHTCVSCHELSFDPAFPERQLPHGKPREVILALQEFYARRYTDPAAAPVVRERRRLPGRSDTETVCTSGALLCARQAAAAEIEAQFTRRGCVTCHEVNDTQSSDVYERYQVRPVKLAHDFFPAARFDHAAHRIQKELTGDAACLSCHAAANSDESVDLLLPDVSQCLTCHRTEPHAEQIATPCSTCHGYHPKHVDAPVFWLTSTSIEP